ncbi:MAG: hypothetical protein ACRDZ9_10000 [Acidimicrobiales bacterium]
MEAAHRLGDDGAWAVGAPAGDGAAEARQGADLPPDLTRRRPCS